MRKSKFREGQNLRVTYFQIMVMHSPETISVFYGNGIRLKRRRTYEELLYTAGDTQVQSMSLKRQALYSSYSR